MNNKKTTLLIFVGFALTFLIAYSYIFNKKLDLNGDNFSYLLLAKSIAQGSGYTDIYSPGAAAASHFPPGYSALLSIFMFFKINNVVFFHILNGIFMFISVCLLASWMKNITRSTAFVFSVGILILLNNGLLSFASMVMSEIPYLFFTCLTFWGIYKLDDKKDFWRSPYFYLLVASAAITYYMRSIALALLISIFLYYLIKKQWKLSLAYIASFILLYLPWIIRNKMLGIEGRYFGTMMTVNPWRPEEGSITTFGEFFNKLITNFDETVIKGFKEVIFPFISLDYSVPSTTLAIIGSIILLAFIFYGAWNFGKYRWLLILYILGNIGTFMLWHGGNGARYVHPLAPFILFAFFWGIICLAQKIKNFKNAHKWLPYSFLILVFFITKPLEQQHQTAKSPYPPAYKNYFALAQSFNQTSKKSAPVNTDVVVCCRKPAMFSYYSNCVTTNYLYSLDPKEVIKNMLDTHVDFVVLEQLGYSSTYRYLYPAITAHPEIFELVTQLPNPDTYLLKFNKEKAQQFIQ